MTLKEFGENLEKLNQAYEMLKKRYRKPKIGETIEVAGLTWKVLDKLESGYLVIADKFYGDDREFDTNCNNWESSNLRNELNVELRKRIEEELGKKSLIEFERDLTSLDGQTEYGNCKDYVSLISVDEYRKYRKLLPNMGRYWWTITPDSTSCNGDSTFVCVVSPSGGIRNDCSFDCNNLGVRPICIFSSSIFESEEEEE